MQWAREEGLAHLSYTNEEPSIAFMVVPSSRSAAAARIIAPTAGSLKALVTKPLQLMGILPEARDIATYRGRDWLGDAFGYRKLALIGTTFGKLYALDLGNGGQIIWESYPSPSNAKIGEGTAVWEWKKIAVLDESAEGRILVAAIAQITTAPVGPRMTHNVCVTSAHSYLPEPRACPSILSGRIDRYALCKNRQREPAIRACSRIGTRQSRIFRPCIPSDFAGQQGDPRAKSTFKHRASQYGQ